MLMRTQSHSLTGRFTNPKAKGSSEPESNGMLTSTWTFLGLLKQTMVKSSLGFKKIKFPLNAKFKSEDFVFFKFSVVLNPKLVKRMYEE